MVKPPTIVVNKIYHADGALIERPPFRPVVSRPSADADFVKGPVATIDSSPRLGALSLVGDVGVEFFQPDRGIGVGRGAPVAAWRQ